MKDIIKSIRTYAGISQQELADYLGVSFATVNRWENGHAAPSRMAQEKLLDYCDIREIPLIDFIHKKIAEAAARVELSPNRILLYHGSKSGLVGDIAPISRKICDFGAGFYMGTMPDQPLTLTCDFDESRFYLTSLDLGGVKTREVPADLEWAMFVAYNRGKMRGLAGTEFYGKYEGFADGCDVITGCIANDKMFQVLDDFFGGTITDAALVGCLSALDLGRQYVAVTEAGCRAVKVEGEIPISHLERLYLMRLGRENRSRGVELADGICRRHRRDGKYFDEIMEEAGEVGTWTR